MIEPAARNTSSRRIAASLGSDRPGVRTLGTQVEATSHLTGSGPVGLGPVTGRSAVGHPPVAAPAAGMTEGGPACASCGAFRVKGSGVRPVIDTYTLQGGPISTEPRINERIRVPEVRLVGPNGEQVGIVPIAKALELAQESDLDLVEVAPTARPPVCKLMDYGKFKYESAHEGPRGAQEPGAHGHQGDEAPAEDRPARLRDQEGSRRPVPQGG